MGPTERSVLKHFWHCYEREWSGQADNSTESNVYTSIEGGRGEKRRRRRPRRQPRQRPTLRGPRRTNGGAGVYSRFGRMEIWDCSILGCAPRRCSVIAEPDFFPLFPAPQSLSLSSFSSFPSSTTTTTTTTSSSSSSSPSFVFPPGLTLTYKCVYACASDCFYLSHSIFSFSFLLFLPSLCMMRPTRVYLTPRTTNEESSRAQATSRTWCPPLFIHRPSFRLLAKRIIEETSPSRGYTLSYRFRDLFFC